LKMFFGEGRAQMCGISVRVIRAYLAEVEKV
jgi:hypothetical protein